MLICKEDHDGFSGLEFHVMDEAFERDFDECCFVHMADLIAKQFTTLEPLTTALGLQLETYRDHFVVTTIEKARKDGLSIVALDMSGDTPLVAAVFLNEDFHDAVAADTDMHPMLEQYTDIRPIFQVMNILDCKIVEQLGGSVPRKGLVLHAFVLAVSPGHAGRGLAKKLSSLTCQLAKEQSFSHVAVEATNPATARIWTKTLGAEIVHSMNAKDFLSSDKEHSRPFATLDHTLDALLLKL
jgi:hypothetical protein